MKNLKIQVPEGYEIDKEKSTFEEIIFKKKEDKLPTSVDEIEGRRWYINEFGFIKKSKSSHETINQVSSEERAEAFLALMQLVELRDAWNGDWKCEEGWSYVIVYKGGRLQILELRITRMVLCFKDSKTAEEFLETFRGLIETAKELI